MDESVEKADRGPSGERDYLTVPRVRPLHCDENGHAIEPSKEELEEDYKAWRQALEVMDAVPDDPSGSDEAFLRAIGAIGPDQPLFAVPCDPDSNSGEEPTMFETTEENKSEPIPEPTPLTLPRVRPLQCDEQGHAIAPSKEELEEDYKAWRKALEVMDAVPDDPPGSDEAFWRAIDAERPHRPLFKEFYES